MSRIGRAVYDAICALEARQRHEYWTVTQRTIEELRRVMQQEEDEDRAAFYARLREMERQVANG